MEDSSRNCRGYCQVITPLSGTIVRITNSARLALYDIVIYIDDSGSMAFEEQGERIKDLELIMQRVAFAATLFDEDGYVAEITRSVRSRHLLMPTSIASKSVS